MMSPSRQDCPARAWGAQINNSARTATVRVITGSFLGRAFPGCLFSGRFLFSCRLQPDSLLLGCLYLGLYSLAEEFTLLWLQCMHEREELVGLRVE
ncbi:MAG TPA: hypothetical protein VK624_21400 [Steroidobacteraceae bacterium]|nr:hypothetical protein [Steroidobacteraceae bacterium]